MESSNTPNPVADTEVVAASSTENSASQAPETSTADISLKEKIESLAKPEASTQSEPIVAAVSEQPPVNAFTPNWKYKAFGKEKEIDEFWRPLVKDPDSEKKVKDIFTKADAFEDLKSRYEFTQKDYQEVLTEHQALDRDVRKVMKFKADGDYENFFQALRIPDQDIFNYVQKRLDLMNLPPEQRQALEMQSKERQRLYELEEQNQYLEQTYQTQAVQARTMQLDSVLSRPDISSAASAWDSKTGQLGSFRDLVIEEGQKAFYTTGQDLPVEHVVNMVVQKFGKFLETPQASTPNFQTQQPQSAAPQVVAAPKPVIPNLNGRGTSPVKRSPKSLDELKSMAKEMSSQGL